MQSNAWPLLYIDRKNISGMFYSMNKIVIRSIFLILFLHRSCQIILRKSYFHWFRRGFSRRRNFFLLYFAPRWWVQKIKISEDNLRRKPLYFSVFHEPINPFRPSVAFDIETSHLICPASQMTGFNTKYNTDYRTMLKSFIKKQSIDTESQKQ